MLTQSQVIEQSGLPAKLVRAVYRQTGAENLEDIARHGADAGFAGFTYYTDTVAFFKRNRAEIARAVETMAAEMGESPMEMIAGGFRCLQPADVETKASIGRCLYGGRLNDSDTQVANALAWFAAEEVARASCPDL